MTASERLDLLGIPIDNLTMAEALAAITRMTQDAAPHLIAFVNAHCANIAAADPAYLDILRRATLVLADGIGMRIAGQWLGTPIRENVNGTDLFPLLCNALQATGATCYFLGGRPGVADGVVAWVRTHAPQLQIAGWHDGYFGPEEIPAVTDAIRASGATVLLVALGVPQQEVWLDQWLGATGARVGVAVGGLFDFYSGRIPRAPRWMRRIGFEWLYRFLQEPGRLWKRYLVGNAAFLWRVWRARPAKPATNHAASP